ENSGAYRFSSNLFKMFKEAGSFPLVERQGIDSQGIPFIYSYQPNYCFQNIIRVGHALEKQRDMDLNHAEALVFLPASNARLIAWGTLEGIQTWGYHV